MNEQPKKFQFILNPDAEVPDILGNAPDGWDKTTIEFKRSATYLGVIRSLTLPYKFVTKGAGIVRNAMYSKFLMARLPIQINKQNTLTWAFEQIFKGRVDFTQFDDGLESVQATLVESSYTEKVAAYDSIKYSIPVDVPEAIDLILTPLPFKEKATFFVSGYHRDTGLSFAAMDATLVNYSPNSITQSVQDVSFSDASGDFRTKTNWIFSPTMNTTVIVSGNIYVTNPADGDNPIGNDRMFIYKTFDSDVILPIPYSILNGVDFLFTIEMQPGQRLFLLMVDQNNFQVQSGSLVLNYQTQSPASQCKAIPAFYLYDQLIQKMNGLDTGGAYTRQATQSYLLKSTFKDVYFTCSNSIRKIQNGTQYDAGDNLLTGATYLVINDDILYNSITYSPNEEFTALAGVNSFTGDGSTILLSYPQQIVTSFKDFYQWLKSAMGGNAGFGVENEVATAESLDNYFRNVTMLDISDQAIKPSIKPALDYVFNAAKVGNDDPQLDSQNAQQAVNSQQNYVGDLTSPAKELDLISPYIEEAYAIETIRFTPNDTAASRSDNSTCVVWCNAEREPFSINKYKPLTTLGYTSLVGVDAGSAYYNYNLSPKHKLLRGAPYLAAVFYGQTNIKFASALKNVNMVVVGLDGVRVAERDSLLVGNLGQPVFVPITFEFTLKLQEGALNALNMMYGAVKFEYRGDSYAGFIIDSSVDAAMNSERTFTLLSVPLNVFMNLVH